MLDIFWETSSNGLISELNEAVLSENVGAFELVGFNDILFFEDLTIGSDIISGLGMTAQDVFGNDIPAADFDIELVSPSGGFAITDATGADRTQDFDLVETSPGSGFYQIKTRSLFVFLADSAPREFNFNFRVTNNTTSPSTFSFFTRDAQLRNVEPSLINCLSSSGPPPYDGPNGSVPPQVIINQDDTIAVNIIEGENGSAFFSDGTTGPNGNKFRGGEELEFEIVGQVNTIYLTDFGGDVTEQNALDGVFVFTGTDGSFIEFPLPPGPFTMNTTSATSNLINNGVTFATLNKPDVSQPSFFVADIDRGYQDWAVYVQIKDASGSINSLSGNTLCRIIVRINYSLVPRDLFQLFITPRDLAGAPDYIISPNTDTYVDATAEVDQVISLTEFTIKNLSGDNVNLSLSQSTQQGPFQGNMGPIFATTPPFTEAVTNNPSVFNPPPGPAGEQIYSTSLRLDGQGSWSGNPQYWYPPNAKVLGGTSLLGEDARVAGVEYFEFDSSNIFTQVDYGTTARVTTFTPHNVTGGDQISFTSGRWLVTGPGNTGLSYTQPVFPRKIFGPSVPFISPITNQQQTQDEMCDQVTNGSPAKLGSCQFVQVLTEREDQIPQTPFTAIIGGGLVNTGISGMIAPGSEYGGTIDGCSENCQPG